MTASAERAARPALARRLLLAAALAGAVMLPAQAQPTSRQLAARAVQLQLEGIEAMAQGLIERPAALMVQDATAALPRSLEPARREAATRRIQDSARRYVDDAVPMLRERAARLAPLVLGAEFERRFSADELSLLVAWLESPVSRKYQQMLPDLQQSFVRRLVADARPLVDPKLKLLDQNIRAVLETAAPARPQPGPAGGPASAASPASLPLRQ